MFCWMSIECNLHSIGVFDRFNNDSILAGSSMVAFVETRIYGKRGWLFIFLAKRFSFATCKFIEQKKIYARQESFMYTLWYFLVSDVLSENVCRILYHSLRFYYFSSLYFHCITLLFLYIYFVIKVKKGEKNNICRDLLLFVVTLGQLDFYKLAVFKKN